MTFQRLLFVLLVIIVQSGCELKSQGRINDPIGVALAKNTTVKPLNRNDSSKEINSAINILSKTGGGTLMILNGEYTLKSPLKPKTNVKIVLQERTLINIPKGVKQTFSSVEARGENFTGLGEVSFRGELSNLSTNGSVFTENINVHFENQYATNSIIYPEWFGAIPNGVTDCTQAIQNAINASPTKGTIRFGQGTYKVTKGLKIEKPINLEGLGKKGSALSWHGGSEAMISFENSDYGRIIYNSINGLSFFNETTPTVAIFVKGFYTKISDVHTRPKVGWTAFIDTNPDRSVIRLDISNVHISSRKDGTPIQVGINMRRGAQLSIVQSHIQDCLTGVQIGTPANGVLGAYLLENNNIFSSSWLGKDVVNVKVVHAINLKISETAFWPNNDQKPAGASQKGITLQKVEGGTINNNYFTGGGHVTEMIVVETDQTRGLKIRDNSFMRTGGYAIVKKNSKAEADISQNHIIKAVKHGMYDRSIKGIHPEVCFGNSFITTNKKPTTIESLSSCYSEKSIKIFVYDNNTSFDFTSGNIRCGNESAIWKAKKDICLTCNYLSNTKLWYCSK